MKKEFNIIDRNVERVTECFLRGECALKDKPKECRGFLKDSDFCEQAEAELDALLGESK